MQAYTYYLTHLPTGKFYIGSRCKNVSLGRSAEDDFWIHYFTSSAKVKNLIVETGKESFSFKILYKQLEEDEPDAFWWFEQEEILKNIDNPLCLNGHAVDRSTGKKRFSRFGQPVDSVTKEKISKKVIESYKNKSDVEKEIISKKKSDNTKRIHANRTKEEKDNIYSKMLESRGKWDQETKSKIGKKISKSVKQRLAERSADQIESYKQKQADAGWNLKSEEEKQKLRDLRSVRMKEVWERRRLTPTE